MHHVGKYLMGLMEPEKLEKEKKNALNHDAEQLDVAY